MTTIKHQHRAKSSRDRAFAGPVAQPEHQAAHGGIVRIDTCRCGAERRTNINGRHVERGAWAETMPAIPYASISPNAHADGPQPCPYCGCPIGEPHLEHTGRGAAIQQGWKPCEDCGANLGALHVGDCAAVRKVIRASS